MSSYTLIEDSDLEERIQEDIDVCVSLLREVYGRRIVSIVLIGGYGRGEGGISVVEVGYWPKNNYDFLVVLRSLGPVDRGWVLDAYRQLKDILDERLMVRFEASFQSLRRIQTAPAIMIYQDILHASRTVYGKDIGTLLPASVCEVLPPMEALNILRTRSMLLLAYRMNEAHLNYVPDKQQRLVWLAKAILGYGDAILILKKAYKTTYVAKNEAIKQIDISDVFPSNLEGERFKQLHDQASRFRLSDEKGLETAPYESVLPLLEVIYLWALRGVLGRPQLTWERLPLLSLNAVRGVPLRVRNVMITIREFGLPSLFDCVSCHPRDRLHRVVPLLLYSPSGESLAYCRREFNLSENASLREIENVCFRLYLRYIV